MLIRTGDTVEVIAGNDRGQKSKVLKVDRATRQGRRRRREPRLQARPPQPEESARRRLSKEMPVQLSNVNYVCTSCGKRDPIGRALPRRRQQRTVLQEVRRECRPDRPGEEGARDSRNWQRRQTRQDNEGRQEVTHSASTAVNN